MAKFNSDDLFNCCTHGLAPAWSNYTQLELGACVDEFKDMPGDETNTIGGKDFDEAEFFTVYGRNHEGEAEAITDIVRPETALLVAAELAKLSGLPCVLYLGVVYTIVSDPAPRVSRMSVGGAAPSAWYEGVEARRVGRLVNEAPYHPNSKAAKAWANGWHAADALTQTTASSDCGTLHLNI